MATNRTWVTESGEKREETEFHRIVAWNKLAGLCSQLLFKGRRVYVEGRLQTRQWTGQDGQPRQATEIVIEDMIVLTPKGTGGPITSEDLDSIPEAAKAESAPAEEKAPKEETKAEESKEPVEKAPQEEVKDDLPF